MLGQSIVTSGLRDLPVNGAFGPSSRETLVQHSSRALRSVRILAPSLCRLLCIGAGVRCRYDPVLSVLIHSEMRIIIFFKTWLPSIKSRRMRHHRRSSPNVSHRPPLLINRTRPLPFPPPFLLPLLHLSLLLTVILPHPLLTLNLS